MADDTGLQIPLNDLPTVSYLADDDRIPVTQGAEGAYTARNATIADLKTAIYHDIPGELVAGETTLVIDSQYIFETSTIDVYTNVYGVSPKTVIATRGRVTLGFKKQDTNLGVKVRVS